MSEALEPILISAINQYLFCERRCALIHVEGVFQENAYTLQGSFLHESADTPGVENRAGVRIARALPLFSKRLGLTGKADIVEFHKQADGAEVPLPVDYKRGPRRKWDNDDAQLCAQGLCLEEMLATPVRAGAIFHAASKRRREVPFTPELRAMTQAAIKEVRALLAAGKVPPAVLKPRCDGCSLRGVCLPEITSNGGLVERQMKSLFDGDSGLSNG